MEFNKINNVFVVLLLAALLTPGFLYILEISEPFYKVSPAAVSQGVLSASEEKTETPKDPLLYKLANPPEIIKATYMTGYSAGTKNYRNYLLDLFNRSEINAVVVDVKGSDGYITYNSTMPIAKSYKLARKYIPDIEDLVKFLHSNNIYIIGRISVFEDPVFARARPDLAIYNKTKTAKSEKTVLWQDYNGQGWMDPASKEVWGYNVALARDALSYGFDEINFDYIRFPSDGDRKNMGFPIYDEKTSFSKVIKEFYEYLRSELRGEKISADLFGQTTVNKDDLGIGQIIENAFLNFDYICPMLYPSHYKDGFIGYKNPAEHPYEVIKYSLDGANKRLMEFSQQLNGIKESSGTPAQESIVVNIKNLSLAKLRPWLQDFNMGANYNSVMVSNEITATKDSLKENYAGYLLWNPSNIYTLGAIKK